MYGGKSFIGDDSDHELTVPNSNCLQSTKSPAEPLFGTAGTLLRRASHRLSVSWNEITRISTKIAHSCRKSLKVVGDDRTSNYQDFRDWRKSNPLFTNGYEFLRRRLSASGPANPADSSLGVDVRGTLSPTHNQPEWRKGTRLCCLGVAFCIMIELALLLWAGFTSVHFGGPGSGLAFVGDCDRVKNMANWLLLPLNIAATVLIGASNYVMQVVTAPSRSDIDKAHRSAQSLTVCGMVLQDPELLPARRSTCVLWLLWLSSLPIHLLLNSAIYGSVQASDIGVLIVSDGFEHDSTWKNCNTNLTQSSPSSEFACTLMKSFNDGNMVEMSQAQCISQYASAFRTNASSVIVVAADHGDSWYSPPQNASLPASFGLACNSGSLIPDNDRRFNIAYNEQEGLANVSLSFYTNCKNQTHGSSSNDTETWSLIPTRKAIPNPYISEDQTFFHTAHSELSQITSIRSVFSVRSYRYWAAAELTGDYLNPEYTALSHSWNTKSWLCPRNDLAKGRLCDLGRVANTDWRITPAAIPVGKCLVSPMQERCSLHYSWRILVATICCDIVKLTAMMLALKSVSEPLITIGDVIASFLDNPDPCTAGRCLLDDFEARKWTTMWKGKKCALSSRLYCMRKRLPITMQDARFWQAYDIPFACLEMAQYSKDAEDWLLDGGSWWANTKPVAEPIEWGLQDRQWSCAILKPHRLLFTLLYPILTAAATAYLVLCIESLRGKVFSGIWTAGLGGPDPNALWEVEDFNWVKNITGAALIVNLPQLLTSILYFTFNAMFTMIHTAHEWADLSKHRKALRVSVPRGQQRSTYWLQLPWKYSLPLVITSGLLHWLLGRSLYIIKIDAYNYAGDRQTDKDIFAYGFSPLTTLLLLVVLALLGLVLLWVCSCKFDSSPPFVGFNSLAISAACHPDPAEKDVALQPLMWGVVDDGKTSLDVQHCSFSAREVSSPVEGRLYS